MFGCSYLGDGSSSNNVQSVTGQAGTFVEGVSFDYLYGQGPDSYVDIIGSNGGTIVFRSQDSNGRAIFYNGAGNNYRSIHSSIIFGALRDGTDNKATLMVEYMDYLMELTGIEEFASAAVHNLVLSPNPFKGRTEISFGLNEPGKLNIKIYNSVGQLVRNLLDADMAQGDHSFVWDSRDYRGRKLSSGTYMLWIELNGKVTQKALVLVN
ncbi:MAG: FlgD immunoglobulin-like domain containing protein [bacterium]